MTEEIKYKIFDEKTNDFVEYSVNSVKAKNSHFSLNHMVYNDVIINPQCYYHPTHKDRCVPGLSDFTLTKKISGIDFISFDSWSSVKDFLPTEYRWLYTGPKDAYSPYLARNKTLPIVDEEVLFLGCIWLNNQEEWSDKIFRPESVECHYGHMIIGTSKSWWLKHNNFKGKIIFALRLPRVVNYEKEILQSNRRSLRVENFKGTFFKKFLLGLNIDPNQVEILTSPKQFSKVIVPDNSLVDGIKKFKKPWPTGFIESYAHKEYKNMTLHIADNLVKKKENTPKKIFFSRKGFWPTIIGNDDIENFFSRIGYKIISPEKLEIEEQMNLVRNCTHLAGFIGSAMHNLIWTENKKVTIINRDPIEKVKMYTYPMIDDLFNHETTYLINFGNNEEIQKMIKNHNVFYANSEKVISVLKDMDL